MRFNLKGKASLNAIAVTRAGDEGDVTAALRLVIENQRASAIAGAIGADCAADVEIAFHDLAAEPERRFVNIASIKMAAAYTGKHSLTVAGFEEVRVAKVDKIEAAPGGNGTWVVAATVKIENPPARMLEVLAELLRTEVAIDLRQDDELALEGGGRSSAVSRFSKHMERLATLDGIDSVDIQDGDGNVLAKFTKGELN